MPTDHTIGIGLLLCVVALWTASSFLTSSILVGGETYDKPFLVTWLCTASFTLYLAPRAILHLRRRLDGHGHDRLKDKSKSPVPYTPLAATDLQNAPRSSAEGLLDTRETAILGTQFCMLWFVANYTMNASLSLTSVSSMTVLVSTSGLFTLAIGRIARVEVFSSLKLAAVMMSILGVIMVSRSDSAVDAAQASMRGNQMRLFGDVLALTSALLYAVYVIFLKVKIGKEDRISMPLFFGFVGLANTLCLWPFLLVLHVLGIERLAWPPSSRIWISLLVNALITFVADYLYIFAMLKTSPLLVTVGMSLTIPAAVTGDLLQGTPVGSLLLFLCGAALVVFAFVLVGLAGRAADAPLLREDRIEGSEDA